MEGNNYRFKFDSNKIEKSFDNGSKLSIENDGGELNMSPDRRYVTANNPNKKESNKKLVRVLKKNVTTDDRLGPEVVSPGNKGFASVIGLAALIAVAGVIIAFITLKY